MSDHASSARSLNAAQPREMIQIHFFPLVSLPCIQSSHVQSVSTRAHSGGPPDYKDLDL